MQAKPAGRGPASRGCRVLARGDSLAGGWEGRMEVAAGGGGGWWDEPPHPGSTGGSRAGRADSSERVNNGGEDNIAD